MLISPPKEPNTTSRHEMLLTSGIAAGGNEGAPGNPRILVLNHQSDSEPNPGMDAMIDLVTRWCPHFFCPRLLGPLFLLLSTDNQFKVQKTLK